MKIFTHPELVHGLQIALRTKAPLHRVDQCCRSYRGTLLAGSHPLIPEVLLHYRCAAMIRPHRILYTPNTRKLHLSTCMELWYFNYITLEYGQGSNHFHHLLREIQNQSGPETEQI